MSSSLKLSHHYQRKATHVRFPHIVGTERMTYLVQEVDGKRLVSAWLNRQMDPDAPKEIWVQDTDKISERATRLFRQNSPIHLFIKESKDDRWSEYLGEFELRAALQSERVVSFRIRQQKDLIALRVLPFTFFEDPADEPGNLRAYVVARCVQTHRFFLTPGHVVSSVADLRDLRLAALLVKKAIHSVSR